MMNLGGPFAPLIIKNNVIKFCLFLLLHVWRVKKSFAVVYSNI